MLTIFLKSLREKWLLTVILIVVALITLWMYIALFPTIAQQSAEYEKLLAQFPKEMWKIFGVDNGQFSMTTLESFFSIEMFSFLWPIMSIALLTVCGVGYLAGEIDSGTMELLLALPISRIKIFLGKYVAGLLLLAIFTAASTLSIIPLAGFYAIPTHNEVYLKLFLAALAFMCAGFSIAMLFASLFDKGKATSLTVGLLLAMYIINIVSSLKDSLKNLQYLSFFYYMDLSKVLMTNILNIRHLLVFLVITVISTSLAVWIFHKRDISV